MLIGGILLGLVIGLLAGGNLLNLAAIRLRLVWVLFAALLVRFGIETALAAGLPLAETFRLPLFALAFWMLIVALWANRARPGIVLAMVGVLLNATAILANGGHMPIWQPSVIAAGFDLDEVNRSFHVLLPISLDATFLLRAGPFGDILPIPIPGIRNVASLGDLFLSAGLGFFLFASVLRTPKEAIEEEAVPSEPATTGRAVVELERSLYGLSGTSRLASGVRATELGRRVRPRSGLEAGLASAAALDRPLALGGPAPGMASPGAGPTSALGAPAGALQADAVAVPRAPVTVRVRRHPFIRLALNGSFTALWAGQLISLLGDRIHQIALAFLVAGATGNSPIAVAGVFLAATLPNLLLSPVAGAYVDRWDQKDVMVVSDLLRAATVLMIPIAAVTNLLLVYPLVFGLTAISIFFRPARVAALPRIVREDELLTANSAMWMGETIADVVGYPLAGIFVTFLGPALPLAFWIDAGTYAASAALIASVVIPRVRRTDEEGERRSILADMREGFSFLRGEAVLFANTIQAAVAQFTIGALTVLAPLYAISVANPLVRPEAAYSFLETAIGAGNLIGGFVLGLIGARFARGKTIVVGYTAWGLCVVGLALTNDLAAALGLMLGSGIANMVFVIPSQTMFQERTPAELMGRVIGFRFALVFGSMTIAMGISGVLAQLMGVGPVLAVFGLMTAAAGLSGLLVPAVRDA